MNYTKEYTSEYWKANNYICNFLFCSAERKENLGKLGGEKIKEATVTALLSLRYRDLSYNEKKHF